MHRLCVQATVHYLSPLTESWLFCDFPVKRGILTSEVANIDSIQKKRTGNEGKCKKAKRLKKMRRTIFSRGTEPNAE